MTALAEPAALAQLPYVETPAGRRPRVTAVMREAGLTPEFAGVPAEALAYASARGTRVHEMIADAHRRGVPPARFVTPGGVAWRRQIDSTVEPYWRAALAFVADTRHVPVHSELLVVHERWRYAGHLDRVGDVYLPRRRGALTRALIDWKCVARLDEFLVRIQLAAYRLAYNDMHPAEAIGAADCAAVQLRKDETYRLYVVEREDLLAAEQVWLAAMTLYHAKLKAGRVMWAVPRGQR